VPNWGEVLGEIRDLVVRAESERNGAVDIVRRRYLKSLHKHTGRNVIAYYSGWLSKPGLQQSEISDEDKNGFMMAVHGLENRGKGLDLLLHTPGGAIGATHSLVDYLHQMFAHDIRVIVPQIAMSAGTMIACCASKIIMAKHANLGPIDPHIRGLPAQGVIEEFRTACEQVSEDPARAPIWQAIIAQYEPAFLSRCENAIEWSNGFVQEQLERVMFSGESDAKEKARGIVEQLADYGKNRTHERHIHYEECRDMGLRVERLEDEQELQDLVLTVHHCYMHSLMNTASLKMIENHLGAAFVKQARQATT